MTKFQTIWTIDLSTCHEDWAINVTSGPYTSVGKVLDYKAIHVMSRCSQGDWAIHVMSRVFTRRLGNPYYAIHVMSRVFTRRLGNPLIIGTNALTKFQANVDDKQPKKVITIDPHQHIVQR
ncbi:hypothetical protein DPMN_127879 [Dreissena polymorpha]|uniref:Uncharacterized protein n=1 Tax=Dreissena polymorpha TaxID=45954 RepID=A0A9D4H1Z6_DREPO|nr:hypothetical protein DPMN_127879 [Dreissena polymorpha]